MEPTRKRFNEKNPYPNMSLRNGIWCYRKTVIVNGKRRRPLLSTHQRDYKLAEIAAKKIESEIAEAKLDQFIERKKAETKVVITYRAMAQRYLDEVTVHKPSADTLNRDENNLKPSMAYFGAAPITAITGAQLTAWMVSVRRLKSKKGKPYADNCVRNFITGCRTVFGYALRTRELERNPWLDVENAKALTPPETVKERTISIAEQEQFLKYAEPEIGRAFTVMILTGVREDELLRLCADDNCDFANMTLRLTGRVVKGKAGYAANKVVREVPMHDTVATALQAQIAERRAGLGTRGLRKQGPQLWNMSNTTLSAKINETRVTAGILPFTEHDLRRTFATRCADANVNPLKLQRWMGHRDLQTTTKFYVKSSREESRAELLRLDIGAPVVEPE